MSFCQKTHGHSGAPLPVTVVILGGGEGKRLGMRKLFLEVDGRSLLDETLARVSTLGAEILLSCSAEDLAVLKMTGIPARRPELISRIITDSRPGTGPLEGLLQGLETASCRWIFLVGCDMPFLMENVARRIWSFSEPDADVIIPVLDGYIEPLHAFYSRKCLPAARCASIRGCRKMTSFFEDVVVKRVNENCFRSIPGYRNSFRNVNTYAQLLRWRQSRHRDFPQS